MDDNGKRVRPKTTRIWYRFRRPKGSGIFFVLLLNLLVFSYQQDALLNLVNSADILTDSKYSWLSGFLGAILAECLPKLLYPFAGWLADAKLGRYKLIRYGLWIMWVAAVLLLSLSILNYIFSPDISDPNTKALYGTLPLAILIYVMGAVGTACFHVNIIPFGIDQMEGSSSEEISSFIHWYYLTRNINFGIIVQFAVSAPSYYCNLNGNTSKYDLSISLFQTMFLTGAVCLDLLFSVNLSKDPKIHNPVKKVKAISKFILKHKQQVGYRQALTYTFEVPPARSDFAKESYGGYFSEDDVEDVMAFWRLVLFLVPIGFAGFMVVSGLYNYSIFFSHMDTSKLTCSDEYIATNIIIILVYVICIPLFEIVIYPLFQKYLCRITVKIGIGMVVILVGYFCLLAADVTGHVLQANHINSTSLCIFRKDDVDHLKLSPFYIVPAIVIITIGELFVFIGTFEFICAQSPYSMRGLIFGTFYFIYGIFIAAVSLVLMGFAVGFGGDVNSTALSCGSSYILAVIAMGVVGLLLYLCTVKWYRYRQRGGQSGVNHQAVLEHYYDEHIRQRDLKVSVARL